MALDPFRAAFVQQEFRFAEATDAATLATYTNANIVEINANLSQASAQALANSYLAATKGFAQVYEVVIEKALNLEDFVTAPPQFTVSFPRYNTDGRTFRLVSAEVDYMNNLTTLVVRG